MNNGERIPPTPSGEYTRNASSLQEGGQSTSSLQDPGESTQGASRGGQRDALFKNSAVSAALYFLDTGDYLFKWKERAAFSSKCVAAPDVAAAFSLSEIDSGWLPKGIVRQGYGPAGRWCVFEIVPARATLKLPASSPRSNPPSSPPSNPPISKSEIGGGNGEEITLMLPHMVMLGIEKEYYLFALAEPFRPGAKAYKAPFPNVHHDGLICWGNNDPPKADPERMQSAWQMFLDTPFNGDAANQKSVKYGQDVRKSLVLFQKMKAYPVKDLVFMSRAIGEAIEERIKEKNVHVY